jgi:hypothetical protein
MHGLPISVLILILVAVAMTVIAKKTTFGRYIFRAGGNPDAAELSGINTRALTVKIFALMGFLARWPADRAGAPAKPRQRHRHAGRAAGDRRSRDRRHGRWPVASARSMARSLAR